jgi:hypothetical protein
MGRRAQKSVTLNSGSEQAYNIFHCCRVWNKIRPLFLSSSSLQRSGGGVVCKKHKKNAICDGGDIFI